MTEHEATFVERVKIGLAHRMLSDTMGSKTTRTLLLCCHKKCLILLSLTKCQASLSITWKQLLTLGSSDMDETADLGV